MDHRSPLDNIFNIIGGLPQGHDKPVKHALYNALALFLLFVCCAALWALYLILEPFIKPLIWALLVGSVLHPFKYTLAQRFKIWFDMLDESRTPIIIGMFIIPVNIVDDLSEFIGCTLKKHWKIMTFGIIGFGSMHSVYYYTPRFFIGVVRELWLCSNMVINLFIDNASTTIILVVVIGYLSLMVCMWNPGNNKKFHYASMAVWLLISCFVARQFGSFQIAIFIVLQLIFFGGFVSEVVDIHTQLDDLTIIESIIFALQGKERSELKLKEQKEEQTVKHEEPNVSTPLISHGKEEEPEIKVPEKRDPWSLDLFDEKPKVQRNTSLLITDKGKVHIIKQPSASELSSVNCPPKVRRSHSQPSVGVLSLKSKSGMLTWRRRTSLSFKPSNDDFASDFYICTLLWLCGVMFFWKNIMFVPILAIPILVFVTKRCGAYLGVWSWLHNHWAVVINRASTWCQERHDAIVPVPIRGLYRIIYKINLWLKRNVKESIDTVSSCVVMLGLIIFVVCASIFILVQVYAEAIMLVQMTSNVINQTVVHNPELRQLLPPTFDSTVDSILDNAYQYGREGISKAVRGVMSDVDPSKREKLENQVLELWDRIYQTWMASDNSEGPKVTSDAVQTSWNNFIDDLQKSPEMFNLSGIMSFINQNVGTLLSLLDSVWSIVKGNISLLLGSFSAIVSVLLGGGTAVLNFILNLIIFLTTLFYLLSSSGELYKPVELMTQFSTNGSRFGLALGDAINGVFTASFKMAAFYGLWTWFIHNLFGVRIVYLPSVVAAILGAAPFLGTYWACIPAIFDLWLAQEKGFLAILFVAAQFLPTSVVDATIYAEMKGGHPYLTGLAIAGGIFCLGLEGAIMGPLVLCGLYVAMDLSTTLFKDSPSEETLNLQQLSSVFWKVADMIRHLLLMSGFSCIDDCSGRGECHNGTCVCEIRFAGDHCDGPNLPYHAGIGGVFLLVALVCAVQLMTCIISEYQRLKAPTFLRACKITTQKLLYFVTFLASVIRGAYFLSPDNFKYGWSNSLLSAYYPLLMSGFSLIVCFWAEVFHLRDIRWEKPQFLSKSFLGFVTFNIISFGLLLAEIVTTHLAEPSPIDRSFYTHIFNGCYAVLLFIVAIFFLIYGVEVFFKVRGGFVTKPVQIAGSGESQPLRNEEIRPLINNSQLHQSRIGLLSQALMMIIIVGFLFSETLSEFWKTKVPVNSRNWHDIVFRVVEIGVAIWFPAVLWNCIQPAELWILNPKKLLAKLDQKTVEYLPSPEGNVSEEDAFIDNRECWICYDSDKLEPLIQPCDCTGDVSSVHHDCLRRWLMESSSSSTENLRCKVCNCAYDVSSTTRLDWEKGFTAKHWGSTVVIVTCLCLAVAICWIVIQMFEDSYIRMGSASFALLIIYVCIKFLGLNTVNAYQRAKVGALSIGNHVTTISANVAVDISSSAQSQTQTAL